MFGRRQEDKGDRPAPSPRSRASLYALCALYLGYLLYQLLNSASAPGAVRPAPHLLALGVVILGGGAVALLFTAWRIYRTPEPREVEEALPEETEGAAEKAEETEKNAGDGGTEEET